MEVCTNNINKFWYEAWALGYDKEGMCTDIEELLGEFQTQSEALKYASELKDLSDICDGKLIPLCTDGDFVEVWVEKVRCVRYSRDDIGTESELIQAYRLDVPEAK